MKYEVAGAAQASRRHDESLTYITCAERVCILQSALRFGVCGTLLIQY
jgi:hypothetical protein